MDVIRELRVNPLDGGQTAELALALAASGKTLDWTGDARLAAKASVDLPSTGGTSNKTPIIAPLLALAAARSRLFVPKFSSRGGPAGTIDILETVGYDPQVPVSRYRGIVAAAGISNVVHGPEFAPADGELMRLRRRVNGMNVPELVVSSIIAKKLASGCRNIVVDVKVGPDSKFGDLAGVVAGARLFTDTARTLVERGRLDGLWVCCTNGCRPQGRAFGRLAALWESARVLAGAEPGFLLDLNVALAARMLMLARSAADLEAATTMCRQVVGAPVLAVAEAWLAAHGARTDFLRHPDLLFDNVKRKPFESDVGGVLLAIDIAAITRSLKRLALPPGGHDAAGVIFRTDPSSGRSLAAPLGGMVLGAPGARWSADETHAASAAVRAYHGGVAVPERPAILYERAITREGELEQTSWSRVSRSAAAVVRRPGGEEVLLVFNHKWNCWNLPAGHFEADVDADTAATVARELSEELGPEFGEPAVGWPQDFELRPLGSCRDLWRSASGGVWTYYDMDLFAGEFASAEYLDQLVSAHPSALRWATLAELRVGRLTNGASVAAFPTTRLALENRLGDWA